LDEAIGELAASWPAPPMKCEILRARDHDAEAAIALRRALEGYSAARHKRGSFREGAGETVSG
jgi:hypothetical protein